VAEASFAVEPAFAGHARPGRFGRAGGSPLSIVEHMGFALVAAIARPGRQAGMRQAGREGLGLDLPEGPKAVFSGEVTGIGIGPGRWLLLAEGAAAAGFSERAAAALSGHGLVSEQSSARGLISIKGPEIREMLTRGVTLDLDARVFGPGDAAATAIAHVDATLWQSGPGPVYRLLVPRGFAGSFWHWLDASAAPFGYEFVREKG
jgi:sarcosine oxidase subunit gamma